MDYIKYNQRGEIESVYYPYSESLEVMAKKEALEAGLYPNFAEFEWYNFSSEEQTQIKEALGRMKIQVKQPQGQRVWSEHYTYDNNSNRLTKTTKFGTINYTYDDENRLRYSGKENLVNLEAEIGGRITFKENGEIYYAATNDSVAYNATSLKGTRYTYDKNGNMLSSENLYSVKFFDYNENNRMKLSTVTDLTEHSYTATTYAYDGFGRRTLTQTQGETATRTLYDGTSFEILRQGTADSNGSFVNVSELENQYSPFSSPTRGFGNSHHNNHGYSDFMFNLFFGGIWGFGNGGHGSNNGKEEAPEYLSIENMYPIYANGSVSGTYTENLVYSPHQDYWNKWQNFWGNDASKYDDYATYKETLYFGTDLLGSVRSTSNIHSSEFGSVSYDIFGSPYQKSGSFLATDSLDFGYLGKPYNADTGLYDYGFRDYSPEIARFTTVDPIRDGRNWYSYVVNDPVNYVDLWGLAEIIADNLVQLPNNKITDTQKGSVKNSVEIVVQRTENHTKGHYLSTISIVIKSDTDTVTLFSNAVQSWADKATKENEGFTIPAGNYEGRLYGNTTSYNKTIGLVNEYLEVYEFDNVLIHGNVMNNFPIGDERRKIWFNTGSSEACQILQGQDKSINTFTKLIENLGFNYGNGYKNYTDTINVKILDPEGIVTTRDSKELRKNN